MSRFSSPTQAVVRECPDCGLFQNVPAMQRGEISECARCGKLLRRSRIDPVQRPLALSVAGLTLLAVAAFEPFMRLSVKGYAHASQLVTGPVELQQFGMPELAIVVLATTLLVPIAKLAATAWVLWGVHTGHPTRLMTHVFRIVAWLRPWAMVEVFLLGLFVAYTKLIDLARIDVGIAVYALGVLVVVMAAADATMDDEAIWSRLVPLRPVKPIRFGARWTARMLSCNNCALVCDAGEPNCPRCGANVHARKRHSRGRCWALMVAAAILYIPANAYPVLTLIRLGRGEPSTIVGGVGQLADAGMWPLAILVFVASICVPVFKIVSLTVMLTSVHRRSASYLQTRTVLYRIVDIIGRWSMIDVFMISILTALVRLGFVAQVFPGIGVIAFCSVVILTMLAAACFDPRLMWDAAAERATAPAATTEPAPEPAMTSA